MADLQHGELCVQDLLLEIIRGIRPVGDLSMVGIHFDTYINQEGLKEHHSYNPLSHVVKANEGDIRTGLQSHLKSPRDLKAWVDAVLIGDFAELDLGTDEGECLLQLLWDISFKNSLTQSDLDLISRSL